MPFSKLSTGGVIVGAGADFAGLGQGNVLGALSGGGQALGASPDFFPGALRNQAHEIAHPLQHPAHAAVATGGVVSTGTTAYAGLTGVISALPGHDVLTPGAGAIGSAASAGGHILEVRSYKRKHEKIHAIAQWVAQRAANTHYYAPAGEKTCLLSLLYMLHWLENKYHRFKHAACWDLIPDGWGLTLGIIGGVAAFTAAGAVPILAAVGSALALLVLAFKGIISITHHKKSQDKYAEYLRLVQTHAPQQHQAELVYYNALRSDRNTERPTFGDYMRLRIARAVDRAYKKTEPMTMNTVASTADIALMTLAKEVLEYDGNSGDHGEALAKELPRNRWFR